MLLGRVTEEIEDLVFGIIAPIGADVDRLTNVLQKELSSYGYISEIFRLSSLLRGVELLEPQSGTGSISRQLMDCGDRLRLELESGDAGVGLAISRIRAARQNLTKRTPSKKRAWILRTLKHPDEVKLLRKVYGSRFVSVSVSEPESSRTVALEEQIRTANPELNEPQGEAAALIARDENSGLRFGQNVRKTNQYADFYLEIGSNMVADAKRMVDLFFGKPFETPTRDEQAMFHAFASSLRSSDPGRQVGAVIVSSDGDLIASGTNEVPKPGGGQFWEGDQNDQREFKVGRDNNKKYVKQVLQEIFDSLAEAGVLMPNLGALNSETRYEEINDLAKDWISQSRVASLIEFGRITHAEMSAITDCARYGKKIENATIFVTAFPCHMCMRLIIASGIRRIVYVDPYPKSLAVEMYGRMLAFDHDETPHRVSVDVYRGASHRVYERLFTKVNRERDDDGTFTWFNKIDMEFLFDLSDTSVSMLTAENKVVENLRARTHGIQDSHVRKAIVTLIDRAENQTGN